MTMNKAQRLAEAMAVFSQGDVERFGEMLLADDVMWHWPGRSSVAGASCYASVTSAAPATTSVASKTSSFIPSSTSG